MWMLYLKKIILEKHAMELVRFLHLIGITHK